MIRTLSFLLLSIFLSAGISVHGQQLPPLKNIKLSKRTSYKQQEPVVLKVVSYLFQTPIDKKNKSRTEAGQFLLNWMNGTPDHIFYLADEQVAFFNTDRDLLLMYMAALTQYTLTHPEMSDQKLLVLGAMSLVLPYLDQQEDKKSWPKELWQLQDAFEHHRLENYLYP